MNTCESCKYWTRGETKWDSIESEDFGGCDSGCIDYKFTMPDEYELSLVDTTCIIVEYDEEWGAMTGKDFGCVHWEAKEEQRDDHGKLVYRTQSEEYHAIYGRKVPKRGSR